MQITVFPSKVKGVLHAPKSKSSMQRACAAALLHRGITEIYEPGFSNDDLAALDTIVKLGAEILSNTSEKILIRSIGINPVSSEIHCGESGLGIRMFTPIASLSDQPLRISGSGSLVTRPMHFFDEIFPQLGISIQTLNGKLPLDIKGPLKPANITVDGSLSSQFLTGLLMAYSAAEASDVTITVNNLTSKPYIDLTLDVMKKFGMKIPEVKNFETFYFPSAANKASAENIAYTVEGDWSGGAFLLVAGAIAGGLKVKGLQADSTQADKAILDALDNAGVKLNITENEIDVIPGVLKAFDFDATECPDLFPPLVALAAACDGQTTITGAKRLTHKESDRATVLKEEFGKLGILVELDGDLMHVHGGTQVHAAITHSHHDHRIAMAVAVAGLIADGPVVIEDAQAVKKSYPEFYRHLVSAGVKVVEAVESNLIK
ncbi:3-phosphoshikimate 1-carboxyvinyltransferase [Pollutibacter soli]|uniref:3-phosphoshikimate 1-carboxyvinyltransferase n=1 Tax=Pollutibacter soli TaxID=3034157 RepID=UPI003013A82B